MCEKSSMNTVKIIAYKYNIITRYVQREGMKLTSTC